MSFNLLLIKNVNAKLKHRARRGVPNRAIEGRALLPVSIRVCKIAGVYEHTGGPYGVGWENSRTGIIRPVDERDGLKREPDTGFE